MLTMIVFPGYVSPIGLGTVLLVVLGVVLVRARQACQGQWASVLLVLWALWATLATADMVFAVPYLRTGCESSYWWIFVDCW